MVPRLIRPLHNLQGAFYIPAKDVINCNLGGYYGSFDQLQERGLIAQTTNEEKIKELLNNDKVTFYIGFDPTMQIVCM